MSDTPKTPPIFFVRGVPEDLQAAVKAAAKRHGTTIGYIVAEALRRQLAGMEGALANRLYAPAQATVIQSADTHAEQFDMFPQAGQGDAAGLVAELRERIQALEARLPSGDAESPDNRTARRQYRGPSLTPEQDTAVVLKMLEGHGTRAVARLLGFTRDQVIGAERRWHRGVVANVPPHVQYDDRFTEEQKKGA